MQPSSVSDHQPKDKKTVDSSFDVDHDQEVCDYGKTGFETKTCSKVLTLITPICFFFKIHLFNNMFFL